jgi:hypothetical protein
MNKRKGRRHREEVREQRTKEIRKTNRYVTISMAKPRGQRVMRSFRKRAMVCARSGDMVGVDTFGLPISEKRWLRGERETE